MWNVRPTWLLPLCPLPFLLLGACTTNGASSGGPTVAASPTPTSAPIEAAASPLRPYPETDKFLQCVPFARAVSGINIYGDAWEWWEKAAGKYDRGKAPRVGSVLVLQRSQRVQLGHVSVVASIKDSRNILVTHANWGDNGETRGVIHERQPVTDVSPNNDWSQVKMWNIKANFGRIYSAYGFIHQPVNPGARTITAQGNPS